MQKVTDPALLAQLNGGGQVAAPRPTQPTTPGIIVGRPKAPDPYQVQKDQRSEGRAEQDQGLQVQKFNDDRSNTGFTQRDKLRSDYNALPAIKDYRTSIQSLAAALKRGDDGSGDTALIYDYVKALDPTSVVREAEVGMAQGADARFNSLVAQAKKEFGMDNGGNLSPEARKRLRREIITSNVARVQQYNQTRKQFEELAKRNGFDPYEIIGNHDADPFVPLFDKYDQTNKIGRYAGGGGAIPGARSDAPGIPGAPRPDPDEIAFAMDLPGSQTDQVEAGRLTSEQQAALDAFLRANAGNQNFGPQQLNAFYQSLGIEGGASAGDDKFFEAVRSGKRFGTTPDYSEQDARRKEELDAQLRSQGGLTSTGMDYAEGGDAGLYRGASLGFSDEIAGLGGGISNLLRGESFSEGYGQERDLERRAQEISRETAGIAPEIAGGLLAPAGVFGRAENLGQFVRQGAALGGIAGFGEGEGASGSVQNALLGTGVGGLAGGALSQAPRAVNALMQTGAGQRVGTAVAGAVDRLRRPAGDLSNDVVEAGQRQNIPVRLPDALPEARNAMAVAEASPTAGEGIRRTLNADRDAVQARVREVGGPGQALDNEELGGTVQDAGLRYIARSRAQANRLYDRAERAAGDVQILPVQASLAIRRNINELAETGETTNSAAIQYLRDLNGDLARDGGLSIQALRNLRTNMRGQIDQRGLTRTDADRRVSQVLDAAAQDIERALANNPEARNAYREADAFFREKQTFIKDVVQKFTGPRVDGQNVAMSAERAANTLRSMMQSQRGDMRRFHEMVRRLDPQERADLSASVAEQLGASRSGEFSLAALSTNTAKMNPRALAVLFGNDGARAIQDLRVIARAKADTMGGLNNSKSGVVAAGTNNFKDLILAAFGGGTLGPVGAVGGYAARGALERLTSRRAANLLLNPDFTRWVRQTPNTMDPAVINRHFDRLNKIASREQTFLMDAQALQDYLRRASSESVGRAAATGDKEQNNGREQPR